MFGLLFIGFSLEHTEITISEGKGMIIDLSVKQTRGGGRTNHVLIKFDGDAGDSNDIDSLLVPYNTHQTAGSFLNSYWVISVCITPAFISVVILIILMIRRTKKSNKK